MGREPIPTYFFALIVVRQDDRFLLIRERKHGRRWYLPAGRVEPLESLFDAARRETIEEAGFPVRLTGILRFEHWPYNARAARLRVVFLAEPQERIETPEGGPDAIGAAWVTPEECQHWDLRDPDLPSLFRSALRRESGIPLDRLAFEGDPFEEPESD